MEYFEFRAMNTEIVLAAEGNATEIAQGFADARALFNSYEARLSRFLDTSELSLFNRSNGAWFAASDDFFDLVKLAGDLSDETNGLFDPTILDVLENVGYDKSMDEIRSSGVSRPAHSIQRPTYDFGSIEFNSHESSMRLVRGTRIDLGGIAKGWVAEQVARRLDEICDSCAVSAGGDMFVLGLPRGESAWRVSLEDPRDPEETLAILRIVSGAVATSSTTRRKWNQGGKTRHHLIDPRTNLPAETDWLSVTAIAPSAAVAEVFAKALLIAGPHGVEEILARRPGVEFIAVDRNGKLIGSAHARELLDV